MSRYIKEFTEGVNDITPEKIENALALYFRVHSQKMAKKWNILPNVVVKELNEEKG
tara:strand:- start:1073 stop:1240 length:168 start_codon:yes stop_codon:yes gene_type:complete